MITVAFSESPTEVGGPRLLLTAEESNSELLRDSRHPTQLGRLGIE
jgi:hypothetical protein